jgi:hypothetical protein
VTQAELRSLLLDCLVLWEVAAAVFAEADGLVVDGPAGPIAITRGAAPLRWFLQTPERRIAGRNPRPLPSIVALLSALRAALGVKPGVSARIGSLPTA